MKTLPSYVITAIALLRARGFSCHPVGGCVRDLLLAKQPEDYDLTTDALPDQTYACFADYDRFTVGKEHGTIGVVIEGRLLEITTHRRDGAYGDGRHPDSVSFSSSLEEDLARRDLTINAMALDAESGSVIDPFGGREDLRRGLIRCVGDPRRRFAEDHLRMMRALRFSCCLGFSVEEETDRAMRAQCDALRLVKRERILSEWLKLLSGRERARIACYPELLSAAFPALRERFSDRALLEQGVADMEGRDHPIAALACLLRRMGGEEKDLALPLSAWQRSTLSFLIGHGADPLPTKETLPACLHAFGRDAIEKARLLYRGREGAEGLLEELDRIEDRGECFTISGKHGLAIDGRDVMEATGAKGEEIGAILSRLLESVLSGRLKNERGELLDALRHIAKEQSDRGENFGS